MSGPVDIAEQERVTLRNTMLDELCITREPGWLQAFVERAWPIVESRPLVWNWHMSLDCEELELVADGVVKEVLFEQPPGTAKSLIVSALFPAAMWLREPGMQLLAMAHIPVNVTRDARKHRDLIKSPWYRAQVKRLAIEQGIGLDQHGNPWGLSRDQNEKINFENTVRGARQVGTVGGGITGARCRGLLVDDPYDAKSATDGSPAQVAERMAYVVDEYDSNWKNRIDPIDGWRASIMQGLAEGDLADVLRKRGVRTITLPMEFDPERAHPRDPRTEPGELLFPARFSREWCEEFKSKGAGQRIWSPQYQQRRHHLGGKLFKREWFGIPATPGVGVQRYQGDPVRLARGIDNIGISVDCTFKDGKGRDRVSVQAWGYKGASRFFLDRVCDRMDITGTIAVVSAMRAKWNAIVPGVAKVKFVLVETAANGEAVITLMRKAGIPNMLGYKPRANKYERGQVTSYAIESGTVWYPMPEFCPWVHEVTEIHVNFTGKDGGDDDDIDAESQMMIRLNDDDAGQPDDALERITKGMGFLKRR